VDLISLTHHDCNLTNYLKYQNMNGYFNIMENLVGYFWVRANIYDKYAARMEENKKVLIDPILGGKTREKLGLKPFTGT